MAGAETKIAFYSSYEVAKFFIKYVYPDRVVILIENAKWFSDLLISKNDDRVSYDAKEEEAKVFKNMVKACSPDIAILQLKTENDAQEILAGLLNLVPEECQSNRIVMFVNGEERV